jgi:hypothetical protein
VLPDVNPPELQSKKKKRKGTSASTSSDKISNNSDEKVVDVYNPSQIIITMMKPQQL